MKRALLAALALVPAAVPGPAGAAPPIVAWTYTVQPGDTLAAVAARMGLSTTALARANGIDPEARLMPGTVLKRPDPADIPVQDKHPVRRPPARLSLPEPSPNGLAS